MKILVNYWEAPSATYWFLRLLGSSTHNSEVDPNLTAKLSVHAMTKTKFLRKLASRIHLVSILVASGQNLSVKFAFEELCFLRRR